MTADGDTRTAADGARGPAAGDGARGPASRFALVMAITVARGPLVVLFMACAAAGLRDGAVGWRRAALASMALSAVTDMFDGRLARKWDVTSRIGALCDPLMDKVFYATVFPTLTAMLFLRAGAAGAAGAGGAGGLFAHAMLMLVFTVLYLLRDQWVSFLRAAAAGRADMRATWSGKLRTAVSFPIGCLLYAHLAFGWLPAPLMEGLELAGVAVNVVSIVAYTRFYGFALKTG